MDATATAAARDRRRQRPKQQLSATPEEWLQRVRGAAVSSTQPQQLDPRPSLAASALIGRVKKLLEAKSTVHQPTSRPPESFAAQSPRRPSKRMSERDRRLHLLRRESEVLLESGVRLPEPVTGSSTEMQALWRRHMQLCSALRHRKPPQTPPRPPAAPREERVATGSRRLCSAEDIARVAQLQRVASQLGDTCTELYTRYKQLEPRFGVTKGGGVQNHENRTDEAMRARKLDTRSSSYVRSPRLRDLPEGNPRRNSLPEVCL